STGGLALVGSSASVGGALRLTAASEDQLGNAWLLEKQQCSGGFDTRFQFRISAPGSRPGVPAGADGFVFAVQNVGPGDPDFLASMSGGTNFTSVFFNTFLNWPGCTDYQQCDVSANSVGVVTNNAYVAQANLDPLGINLKDGAVHDARIAFDGTVITVWIDNIKVLDSIPTPGLNPGTDSSGNGWIGFSSHTGWAGENHDILNWSFCSGQAGVPPGITTEPQSQTAAAGTSVHFMLSASGTLPLTYQWLREGSPVAGATGTAYLISNAQTNDSGTYSVAITNAYGFAISSNAHLTVSPITTFSNCFSYPDFSST